MPYTLTTKKTSSGRKYCMVNKGTGKTYCYSSEEARKKGMQMHEMFKHMPKSKNRAV